VKALVSLMLFSALAAVAVPVPPTQPLRLTARQADRELRILERGLEQLHPGLYRYQSPAGLNEDFARAHAAVTKGIDIGRFYLLINRITASIRCGHTWTNPENQGSAIRDYLSGLPVLPARVSLLHGRLLTVASADPLLHVNDEILAIGDVSIPVLIDELIPYLRGDGREDGKRLSQLDSHAEGGVLDRLLPILHPPREGNYALSLRDSTGRVRHVDVRSQTISQRDSALASSGAHAEDLAWHLDVRGDDAILTLPTFAFWSSEFDWKGFLQSAFETLRSRQVTRLVIDLRQNEGGDSQIGNTLVRYLIDKPYVQPAGRVEAVYERVPYDLARFLDTWDFGFFDRTGKVLREPGRRNVLLAEQPKPTTLEPLQPHFTGSAFALTGPRMSSAGFLVARDLKASGAATLIGEPTGGDLRGLNGGELAWLTLPYSDIAVDIPLIATFHDGQPDSGVQPDQLVRATIEDAIAGRDAALEAALHAELPTSH
jgi:hypothetical protein